MTEHGKLKEMLENLLLKEEDSKSRKRKEKTLSYLIISTDRTGKLTSSISVPKYEVDVEFLTETLKQLGYSPRYEEHYNGYYEMTCYKISL